MKTRVPIGCITIVFYACRRPGDNDNNIIVVFYAAAAASERYSTTARNTTASLKDYKYVYIFISYATSSRPAT